MSEKRMDLSVDVKELTRILSPLLSAQLLSAYYQLLAYARQHGDQRSDDEIFSDCMGDFLVVSQMMEQAVGSLEGVDPEDLFLKLKGHIRKGG